MTRHFGAPARRRERIISEGGISTEPHDELPLNRTGVACSESAWWVWVVTGFRPPYSDSHVLRSLSQGVKLATDGRCNVAAARRSPCAGCVGVDRVVFVNAAGIV